LPKGNLLVEKGVKCGMDISDGLIGDLTHICQESKVGARINIDLVPVSLGVKRVFWGTSHWNWRDGRRRL